jgi:putative FmdB family regulatory protein
MPIYEYKCRECDNRFEKLVSMKTADTEIECPACHEKQVEKVVSVFASVGLTTHPAATTGCTTCSTPFRSG